MAKEVYVTIQLRLTEAQANLILKSSIERVINTSLQLVSVVPKKHDELAETNLQDWEEWKWPIVRIWNALHNAVYREKAGMMGDNTYFTL